MHDDKLKNRISIFRKTRQIREDRYGAVQNNQQYKFIYQYIKEYRGDQMAIEESL